jgi:flap endonuclease-1
MGIKNLNKFLREKCVKNIQQINLSDLTGKKLAIDISIYLYKYETNNALLENIYLMLSIFRQYSIIPVFIFDGKPPPEKQALLKKRREDKIIAKTEYNKLKEQLNDVSDEEKNEIITTMDQLKKQFVCMNHEKIQKVKDLIVAYGATYYDAPGEADELCAMLVIKKKVWACLSEDMDLFVYGCNRVVRYLSLTNETAVLYYTKGILEELNMTQKEFKEICVLSGTDYNININSVLHLSDAIKLFREFQKDSNNMSFYDWLTNTNLNLDLDLDLLSKINAMFDISGERTNSFTIPSKMGTIHKNSIKEILKEDGFMFID